jgi:hypothetical protein
LRRDSGPGYGSPVPDAAPPFTPDAAADARVTRAGDGTAGAPGAWRAELAATLRLAVPVAGVQVGLMLMGVVDVVMVGRVSATALAAVALGNIVFLGVAQFGAGLVMALDPLVSQAVGAGDRDGAAFAVQRGLVLAAAAAAPLALVMWPAERAFAWTGQPADVVPVAGAFVRASLPGLAPYLVFGAVRQTLQAMHRTGAIVAAIVVGNAANLVLNLAFVHGRWGAPALGAVGSAWSSTAARWLMAAVLLARRGPCSARRSGRGGARRWRRAPSGRSPAWARRSACSSASSSSPSGSPADDGPARHGADGRARDHAQPRRAGVHGAVRRGRRGGRARGARRGARRPGRGEARRAHGHRRGRGLHGRHRGRHARRAARARRALHHRRRGARGGRGAHPAGRRVPGVRRAAGGVARRAARRRRHARPDAHQPRRVLARGAAGGRVAVLRARARARGLWWGLVVGLATVSVVLAARVRRRLAGRLARTVA